MVKHITEFTKDELEYLKQFILSKSKTINIQDIKIVGSITFKKELFDKFKTSSSDIDIVIITPDKINHHVEILPNYGYKISFSYKQDITWNGYKDMPYYSLISHKYYYPENDDGVYYQIARKKLFLKFAKSNQLNLTERTFICSLCHKSFPIIEINAYKVTSKITDEIKVFYFCPNCNNRLTP